MNHSPTPSGPPAIEAVGLHKTFRRPGTPPVTAVAGVDLTIGLGEIVALLGPNGAGKTTLLDMVLGLTTPDRGAVQVFGRPPRAAVAAGRVSAVLQTGGLLRDLTVRETVRLIASTHADPAPVEEVIARAGIAGIAGRRVSKCSGGEQQRLRFALALLPDPDLLILDEPTAGMDVSARREFWAAMQAEAAEGRAVVFATHYLAEADDFAERIVVLGGGRVIADAPTSEIRQYAAARTVAATVADPEAGLARLREVAGVTDARHEGGGRIVLRATDSDAVVRLLVTELAGTDLLVTPAGLEDAFVALTDGMDGVAA